MIDVIPGLDGYRVTIAGRVYAEFATLSNAARCMGALEVLASLDVLPSARKPHLRLVSPDPKEEVRRMLRASLVSTDMSAQERHRFAQSSTGKEE